MASEPFEQGKADGRLDAILGWRSEYAWFVEEAPGWSREYSLGYREGWRTQRHASLTDAVVAAGRLDKCCNM